jgi:hypothetical protein
MHVGFRAIRSCGRASQRSTYTARGSQKQRFAAIEYNAIFRI